MRGNYFMFVNKMALFHIQVINNLRSTNRYLETLQIKHQSLFHILCSLADSSADYISVLRKHWTCPICNQSMVITTLEKLEHEASCSEPEISRSFSLYLSIILTILSLENERLGCVWRGGERWEVSEMNEVNAISLGPTSGVGLRLMSLNNLYIFQ